MLLGAVATVPPFAAHSSAERVGIVAAGARLGLQGLSAVLWFYAAHSGLAHVQLGLCHMVGFAAPERYRYPFAAATPREFWMRWNVYFGAWIRVHVYSPIARHLARGGRVSPGAAATASVLAFAWMGAMHELYVLMSEGDSTFRMTACFTAFGAIVAACSAWEASARRRSPRALAVFRVGARAVMLLAAVLGARVLGEGLR
jgi:hypothetical protein